jgi:threonine/homoserine/homoserine lactone efflux protein
MLGIHHYGWFLATASILVITPGQDTFFILGRSLSGGRAAGIAAALGISTGSVIHTFAAALGLSALAIAAAVMGCGGSTNLAVRKY